MKTLTLETRIVFMALVIFAMFVLSPIPCSAGIPIVDDVLVQPATDLVTVATETVATGATGAIELSNEIVVKPTANAAKGAIELSNEIVVKPTANAAKGAIELSNEIVVKPTANVAKGAIKVVCKGATLLCRVVTFGRGCR